MRLPTSLVLLTLLLAGGCNPTTLIIKADDRPATDVVYVAQYTYYHASLVFIEDERLIEYSYGDWDYYAESRFGAWNAFKAVTWPTQGALGRRIVDWNGEDEHTMCDLLPSNDLCIRILVLEVDSDDRQRMLSHLNEAYEAGLPTMVRNPNARLDFVKYERTYTTWHNCNHELVDWLEALGYRVSGNVMLADFYRYYPP